MFDKLKNIGRAIVKTLCCVAVIGAVELGVYELCTPAQAQIVAQGPSSASQVSGLVSPRSYVVVSNLFMTNSQFFGTGTITNTNNLPSILGPSWPSWITNQNVYALAPTMMAPQGSSE